MLRQVNIRKNESMSMWIDPEEVVLIGPKGPNNSFNVMLRGNENPVMFWDYEDDTELATAIITGKLKGKKVHWKDVCDEEGNLTGGKYLEKVDDDDVREFIHYNQEVGTLDDIYSFTKSVFTMNLIEGHKIYVERTPYKNSVVVKVDISSAYLYERLPTLGGPRC